MALLEIKNLNFTYPEAAQPHSAALILKYSPASLFLYAVHPAAARARFCGSVNQH